MKKVLLIAAVASLAMVSCKKEYTCECTASVTSAGSTVSTTASTTIKDTKSKAKETCESGTKASATVGGVTSETKCVIK